MSVILSLIAIVLASLTLTESAFEFSLVDSNGDTVGAGILGLLLSNGGTVCDDYFTTKSAEAVCREMGYMGQLSVDYGDKWDIQSDMDITLGHEVACTSGEWSSCRFSLRPDCVHQEDVFLQCDGVADGGYTDFGDWSECSDICGQGTQTRTRNCTNPAPAHGGADCVGEASYTQSCKLNDCPEFSLVASNGRTIGAGLLGLLISNGGTVCDDFFNTDIAEAICHEMGYAGHRSFTSGDKWDIQSDMDITLDNVVCTSDEWSSCTFSFVHDCEHGEDVFLQCDEVAPMCTQKYGDEFEEGKTYNRNQNTQCTCDARGRHSCTCINDDPTVQCSPPTGVAWYDEECNKICIPEPGTCNSYNDPHYKSFDGTYYDFHGRCTYQAASCDDFKIKLKNKDLQGSLPTYTDRVILEFKGHSYAIHSAGYSIFVDDIKVQVPYYKMFTNGDRVYIENNGELVMSLYSKGRNPSAQLTARRAGSGSWINVAIVLHGSCAASSEGLCGVWNGDGADDFFNNSPNAHAVKYMEYDENCPPPPAPYHPCDDVGPLKKAEAMAICEKLTEPPFSECNNVVPVGDENGGTINTCATEVCNCMMDKSCACPEFDMYAEECIASGVDVSNWRESADYDFCPYDCPEGEVYMHDGAVPAPTCLNKNPPKTGTARGCFCPKGQFLQDEQCVHADQCRCLHEGVFYNNGDEIREEGECEVCTCEDSGEMSCVEMTCPEHNCAEDELISYSEDVCCPYCLSDWVEAVNPEIVLNSGQSAVLTCAIHASDVNKRNINWYTGGKRLSEGISGDRHELTIADAGPSDSGNYTCEAKRDGKTASSTFVVDVHAPIIECTAGNYMTENGCQQCGKNTFSGDGAESCTNCPEDKISVPGSTSEDDCESAPCTAGNYMTDSGCQQCFGNTFSGDGAESCTDCPDDKFSAPGSISEDDCEYAPCTAGNYMTDSGCQQCGENTFSGDHGAESCTDCPDDKISAAGSTSEDDCESANVVTITPVKKKITCTEGKKKCNPTCTVEKTAGNVNTKAVEVCKLADNGTLTGCKAAKEKKGKYRRKLGKVSANTAGQYVCVYSENGVDTLSDPMTITVKAKKEKKRKKGKI